MTQSQIPTDPYVAEFIDMARSAHVYFDLIDGRLVMRAVNPIWEMWRPIRHLLDEFGAERIRRHLCAEAARLDQRAA